MRERVAVVTGAANGLATAGQLCRRGWRVVLADLDGELAERRRADLDDGTDTLAVPADVTDTTAVEAMVAAVADRFGRLDAPVNNAGRPVSAPVESLDDAAWDLALDVTLRCSRAALPLLRHSPAPSVVNRRNGGGSDGRSRCRRTIRRRRC